ncbi:class I SAM-dependent methyltransferase [Enterobacter roggenkampii]|uniref:class I SAM-dependent methyltransferase n=1 Tax=Enterobacter roggenkampii TaxID=1812935 RepID=UPI001D0613AC|nr:methyltransferase domain-containing protein [Enterobacter roggenkampii]MCB7505788.1 methyltransferase domain-containing protein [Enterobacter roggenkampii]
MGSSFYRSFEERHRGSVEEIKRRLSFYLPFLAGLKDVYPDGVIADIGCGRGEWLEILTENGIANIGVDLDDGMLARAREAGLNVQKMDCLQFLQSQADQSLIALTGFHIAEHLPFEVLQQLAMHTLRVLKPGGLLILETPNPENVSVGTCSFYMDPTHNHPLPPPLLEFLPIHYGFNRAITVRLQEKEVLQSPDAAVNLVDVLKGVSPDYSIIAQKAAPTDILERFDTLFTQQYGLTLDALSNRYDAILRQQFSSVASRLETLNHTYMQQISQMSETIQTLQGEVNELSHVIVRYDAILRQQFSSVASRLETLNHTYMQQISQMSETIQTLQGEVNELSHVIVQNHQLHQQMADLHNSRSWRITQPLRWLSLQRQLLRQEGAKVRARRAAKKILRKGMALSLVFFHRYPKSKVYLFKVLRKTGCYTLLQRLFQRVMLVQSDTMMMQSRRYDVGTEEMTSRAMSIYNELKNKNTEK